MSTPEVTTTQKTWGTSIRRYLADFVQLEEIQVAAGGFSSIHHHSHKVNLFVVLKGSLEVRLFDAANDEAWKTVFLCEGEHYSVPPYCRHQFYALTDVEAIELYWQHAPQDLTRIDPEDIVRHSQNGVDPTYTPGEYPPSLVKPRYCARCNAIIKDEGIRKPVTIAGALRDICDDCLKTVGKKP